jgi:2-polyprenyl-6-methoxyphenol hydroxylase-like FAD-dependent oxidoreductase
MSRFTPLPVVVVGNGPVGQTAALLLARWGVETIVLEAKPGRDPFGSRAICQQRDVIDVWDTLDGAGGQIAAEGVTWTTARTFYQDAELFAVDFRDAGDSPFPPWVNISQARTEQVLDGKIAAAPLIETRWGHEVVDLQQDERGVTLVCETADGTSTLRASYAIVAAGARGEALRRALGVTFGGRTFGDQFLICDIRTRLPGWETERRFYFDPAWNPGRQVLIHACPDSTFRIDWQVPEGFDLAAEEADGRLDRRIRQIIGDQDYEIVWRSAYRFHSRVADRLRVGRVLLAGDNAHLVAPFGARGLNSGVQDAENAAWKVAASLQGWGTDELLESYHAERYAAALENLAVTAATMEFLVPQDESERQHRYRILEAAVADPGARSLVDSGRLAEPFWYADSPLTTADPRRVVGGRPARGATPAPAPGVLVPDHPVHDPRTGAPTRLRLLARTGVTVLTGDRHDSAALRQQLAIQGIPLTVAGFSELSPELQGRLGAEPDEVWIVRPDGHLAATLHDPDPTEVRAALLRGLGARDAAAFATRSTMSATHSSSRGTQ